MFICVNTCFHRDLQMCSQCRHMYKLVHMFRHPVLMFAHNALTLCSHVLTLYSPCTHPGLTCTHPVHSCTLAVLTLCSHVLTMSSPSAYAVLMCAHLALTYVHPVLTWLHVYTLCSSSPPTLRCSPKQGPTHAVLHPLSPCLLPAWLPTRHT